MSKKDHTTTMKSYLITYDRVGKTGKLEEVAETVEGDSLHCEGAGRYCVVRDENRQPFAFFWGCRSVWEMQGEEE